MPRYCGAAVATGAQLAIFESPALKKQLVLFIFDAFVNGATHFRILIRTFLPVATPELIEAASLALMVHDSFETRNTGDRRRL
jgi:hypothetical protein